MARKQIMPWEEPHIGVRFGDEADPDCFAGPFFLVELVDDEVRVYRTDPRDRTPHEVVARRNVVDGHVFWSPVYAGEPSTKELFSPLVVYIVCGKETKNGPCQNPLEHEDCDHPVKRGRG